MKSQRDKQLATKDQQIDRLTKLVDQQQQLQLVTVTENRELKDKVKRLSKPVEASDQAKQLRLNNKKESVQTDSTSIRENNKNRSKRWWQIWK